MFKESRPDRQEQTETRRLQRNRRVVFGAIVGPAEAVSGRTWAEMLASHGDWRRDATMHVAVRHGGWRLAEVLREIPGLKYQAAAQGVRRFRLQAEADPAKRQCAEKLKRDL